ncbi:3-hydroxy-D-aspartate aldolase-like [Babylonia areolata]|uniref:3-hydroxy-D-aspartate aldolase-like n=1 Tax=Babylonia areolata TaxID=304850 RepID=UPI003FD31FEC
MSLGTRIVTLSKTVVSRLRFSYRHDFGLLKIRPSNRAFHLINMSAAQKPCRIGELVENIDTPALVVCLEKMEENVERMKAAMAKHSGVDLRPHVKTHKCPEIGRIQMKAGAVGLCCQTVTEAEAMVSGGNPDVFISNQVIGESKLHRVASLAKQSTISLCVDDASNLQDISDVAQKMGVSLQVVVEMDIGGKRCGVETGEEAVKLAKLATSLPGVSFKGLHCYNGINQHVRSHADRKNNVAELVNRTRKALEALKSAGIECNYVTGGGTGSFHFEAASQVFTEVQPGSYIMMDADYARNLVEDGNFYSEFVQSLYVLTTVQSVSADGSRAVVDAGMKAVSLDSGVPLVSQHPDLTYNNGGDNHGVLTPGGGLKVGAQLWLVPGHCDPTVNLYDWIVGLRGGHVECVWPVAGRGPGY